MDDSYHYVKNQNDYRFTQVKISIFKVMSKYDYFLRAQASMKIICINMDSQLVVCV